MLVGFFFCCHYGHQQAHGVSFEVLNVTIPWLNWTYLVALPPPPPVACHTDQTGNNITSPASFESPQSTGRLPVTSHFTTYTTIPASLLLYLLPTFCPDLLTYADLQYEAFPDEACRYSDHEHCYKLAEMRADIFTSYCPAWGSLEMANIDCRYASETVRGYGMDWEHRQYCVEKENRYVLLSDHEKD